MIVISMLMISTVPYMAFKNFKAARPKSLHLISLFLVTILFIFTYPQNSIFIIFLVYLLSGFVGYIIRYWRLRKPLINSFKSKRPDDTSL
jgi:phosphatidylserine synthase